MRFVVPEYLSLCSQNQPFILTYANGILAYRILVGKPQGKRPLGRPRHRWKDNIKMDLREIG
jgi:hypothetical protein